MATILVVDDDPDILRALQFALETAGHRVVTAASGRAGLAAALSGDGDEVRQTLRTHLRVLRTKLGDSATEPRYIRTESGSGYRWVAEAADGGVPDQPDANRFSGDAGYLRHDLANTLTVLAMSCVELTRASDELLALLPGDTREHVLAESISRTVGRGRVAALRAEDLLTRIESQPSNEVTA